MIRIEIDASADQVRQVVAQLNTLEHHQQLVANVSVQKTPSPEAIAKSAATPKLPEKIVPPNPPLVNVPPGKNGSLGGPPDIRMELPKLDPPNSEIAAKEPPAKQAEKPAAPAAIGRVRVAFVLQPNPPGQPRTPAVKKS